MWGPTQGGHPSWPSPPWVLSTSFTNCCSMWGHKFWQQTCSRLSKSSQPPSDTSTSPGVGSPMNCRWISALPPQTPLSCRGTSAPAPGAPLSLPSPSLVFPELLLSHIIITPLSAVRQDFFPTSQIHCPRGASTITGGLIFGQMWVHLRAARAWLCQTRRKLLEASHPCSLPCYKTWPHIPNAAFYCLHSHCDIITQWALNESGNNLRTKSSSGLKQWRYR